MRTRQSQYARLLFSFSLLIFAFAIPASSQTFIYEFSGIAGSPLDRMIFDSKGNLYGTSLGGAVFKLTPQSGGTWTETNIANLNATHFSYSIGGVTPDSKGNLYGTSVYGGTRMLGSVYELLPRSSGGWTFKTLHAFGAGTDGQNPNVAPVLDSSGNLYGVTLDGGTNNLGTVYKLTPQSNGSWSEKVIHSFGSGTDGQYPYASLTFDSSGNIYGTTDAGGTFGGGTVFELTPKQNGSYAEKILYNFGSGSDGGTPYSNVIFDSSGNLYGTTAGGGAYRFGTAFKLTKNSSGRWSETILHSFGNGTDGIEPITGLVFDRSGNLWGTTFVGGAISCSGDSYAGNVFELTPTSSGWTENVFANFCSDTGPGGAEGLVLNNSGNVFGVTFAGGTYGGGAAFEIIP